jgi:hypothetical protein
MTRSVITLGLAVSMLSIGNLPASAAAPCQSINSQCAVEIGGTCDPVARRWHYGGKYGGTNNRGAFDQCISRKLKERKNGRSARS